MLLKPFFPYYGGKWRCAKHYAKPAHTTIIEPFAGSAGYSLRYYDRRVILIEKNPVVSGVWKWLVRATAKDVLRLPIKIPDNGIKELSLDANEESLIGFWLNKGGVSPAQRPSAWMRAGTHNTSFWGVEIRQRIAYQIEAIKHWTIIEGSYESSPNDEATWFVDPPYIGGRGMGRHYKYCQIDYGALASWCKERRGQVIVCEQVGADWLPFRPFMRIKANESKTGGKVSEEAVWEMQA